VSTGSVYQYFPDKRAIFVALHERHVAAIDRMVEAKPMEHAASPIDALRRAMVEAMVEAHEGDPELYELPHTQVPHRAEGTRDFAVRLHGVFRLAIAARANELGTPRDLDTVVFVVTHMVEALPLARRSGDPRGCHSRPQRKRQSGRSLPICTPDSSNRRSKPELPSCTATNARALFP
jgi:AcrR family transcriptional regulator